MTRTLSPCTLLPSLGYVCFAWLAGWQIVLPSTGHSSVPSPPFSAELAALSKQWSLLVTPGAEGDCALVTEEMLCERDQNEVPQRQHGSCLVFLGLSLS